MYSYGLRRISYIYIRRLWYRYNAPRLRLLWSCTIDDIVGDLNNLLDKPLVRAEVKSTGNIDIAGGDEEWTFYTLATINGYVDIKWYGTSNGYYSTAVYVESKSVETITRYLESYIRYEKNYDEKLKVFTNSTNPVINFDTKLLN